MIRSSTEMLRKFKKPLMNRPRFMQEKALSPAEIGTAMHMVMQHVDFSKPVNQDSSLSFWKKWFVKSY